MAEPEKKKKKCFDDLTPELKGLIVDRVCLVSSSTTRHPH